MPASAGSALTQDRQITPVKHLSGGEKARLTLALLMHDSPHVLILDEPTNHLDMDARDALVSAVNDFQGAVILISHDRRLMELSVDQLWLVADETVKPFDGDLTDYEALDEGSTGDIEQWRRRQREARIAAVGWPCQPA